MAQPESVIDQLRAVTRDYQARVAALPFFTAAAGELPLESYAGLLRALLLLHEAIAQAASDARSACPAEERAELRGRLALLRQDLAALAPRNIPEHHESTLRALVLAGRLRRQIPRRPAAFPGYLAILAQPLPDPATLRAHLARTLGDDQGLAYLTHLETAGETSRQRLAHSLGEASATTESDPAVAARELAEGLEQIIQTLYPLSGQQLRNLAGALNPEAGHHRIPDDPREIAAALRAGEYTWQRFPYYEQRYGERGRQFTGSDSAWLVTLAEESPERIDEQISWLGRVLAARGMPQWMLALHLEHLHPELVEAIPERRESYDKLLHAAQALHDRRRAHVPDELLRRLSSEFDALVGPEWSRRLGDAGALLAAAAADERSGIKNAVESLAGWMSDPARFPPQWIAAVETTLRKAREQPGQDDNGQADPATG